jgi:cytochrome c peroxidase
VLEGGARVAGGVGCFHCHSAPNFHFLIELHNNGVITEIEGGEVLDITKAPSLRDVFGPDGTLNGPLFHNGQASTFDELLDHYNNVSLNSELDFRIVNNGIPLNLTAEERLQLEAFIKTLTGADIYSNEMWSDPFDENGSIEIIGGPNGLSSFYNNGDLTLYPNPVQDRLFLKGIGSEVYSYTISDALGKVIASGSGRLADGIDIAELEAGSYSITVFDVEKKFIFSQKFLK